MRVKCYVGRNVHLIWVGRSLAGIFAQPGAYATVELVDWITSPNCIAVEVDGRRLAIELYDDSARLEQTLLDWCDLYAKRNINPIHQYPQRHKIVPFGIHLAAHSHRSAFALLGAIAAALPSGYRPNLHELYAYLVTPLWQDFEMHPSLPVAETILYQTRVWPPEEAPGDELINEERIALMQVLRAEFKHRVVGGLVPTDYARARFPEFVTSFPTRQPQYVQWAKRPAIAIYTRGLFGAIAIKLAEFLAASKAIVTQRLENELPAPLDCVDEFATPEQCVAHCQRLLTHPKEIAERRQAAWEYYQQYVQTPTAMRRLLELTLQSK